MKLPSLLLVMKVVVGLLYSWLMAFLFVIAVKEVTDLMLKEGRRVPSISLLMA